MYKCIIEDQAFSPSYDWLFPPPPLSRQQVVSLSQSSCVSPVELTDERGKEPNHTTTTNKVWSSKYIQYSLVAPQSPPWSPILRFDDEGYWFLQIHCQYMYIVHCTVKGLIMCLDQESKSRRLTRQVPHSLGEF
jgi:hypothetical protein